ncbi:hypothetical protein Swit_2216 [Rhizorhabdus wittichii RW1]|uniref:Uncharacterized protein n=1 Tax=Rhizorhabdus wittichii (strain DSM 6014 / CCUG 31198 / JCM 15750 / NBRC 105917 / EY 4224 / RW1) TaxID=392499 RepID=A0A9J9HBG2_RHIWR|nr:hypothetical protein Swit_2216 [Rhizorhabdus wittichii RW1]
MTDPALTLDGFHPEFADLAERMANDRMRGYPKLVATGQITASAAKHGIFVMSAIAEIWRCATDILPPNKALMAVHRDYCLEELAAAIGGAKQRLHRRPGDPALTALIEQLRAMRWWHDQYPASAHALNMTCMLRHDAIERAAQAERERNAA